MCRGCGTPLYSAKAKFDSGCGWPAFDKCYAGAVKTEVDNSFGMRRVEIMCSGVMDTWDTCSKTKGSRRRWSDTA